jgi:hypothetical protein
MQIRIRTSGAIMYEGEFRQLYASTSFPQQISEATLNDFDADVVFEGPQASGGTVYQYSQAAGVEQVDGKWYTKHVLGPVFTDAETTAAAQEAAYKATKDAGQAASVRATRDGKLAETDWRYRRDQTTTPEWDAYCQALRDLPAQEGFPWTITWPVAP